MNYNGPSRGQLVKLHMDGWTTNEEHKIIMDRIHADKKIKNAFNRSGVTI